MYTIQYRRELNLLDITWSGLFTPEGMAEYAKDCRACWKREGFKAGYLLRIELCDNQPLPQDTLTVLAGAFTDFPEAGRIAMVTGSAISRIQITRAMMVPHMRIFEKPETALDWLAAP